MLLRQQPLVSAIVAVKNETTLLKRCLSSLLAQTYHNVEVIVVNDGSGAETRAVLDQYKDPKLKIMHLESSLGKSGARNLGISQASGEYIAIADSDDAYSPKRFEKQVSHFEKNPELDVLGSFFTVDAGFHTWGLYNQHGEIYHQMLLNNPLVHSSVIFRSSVLQRGFRYNSDYTAAEDYEVLAANRTQWQFGNLRDVLVHYHISKKPDGYHQVQTNEARKIRELVLADYVSDPDQETISCHHIFSEIKAGLNPEQLLQHIHKLLLNYQGNYPEALSRILYTQLMLYAGKHGLKFVLKDRLVMLWAAKAGLYQSLRAIFK